MSRRTLILPIGAGVIGQDDVPLVRIMDSDETPTSITIYGVVDTVQPVESVTWTVNGVEQTGDVSRSPVLELTDLQPETSYAITLRATNVNGESQASARTIWTKKITTITPADVIDGVSYYDYQDVYRTGTMPERDETDITVSGRDVTVPAGHYAESETVSVSSEYIIPTGTKNINTNGTEDVTQYANVNVNVPASAVDTGTKQTNITTNGTQTVDVVGYANNEITVNVPASAVDVGTLTLPAITQNVTLFTQDVTGYRAVAFPVAVPASEVDSGTKQITSNGNGQDVVGYAAVDVNVQPNLTTLPVTPQTSPQTIVPSGNVDGYNQVTVSAVTGAIDPNITASNIRDGVTILGVTGDYQGGSCNLMNGKFITQNGTYNAQTDDGYDGYEDVTVDVQPNTMSLLADQNNTTYRAQDYNVDGFDEVNVSVQGCNIMQGKFITQNGIYNAQTDGFDGYEDVTVDIPQPTYQQLYLQPEPYNQDIEAQRDYQCDGFDEVHIEAMNLMQNKTITQNGFYNAMDDAVDGYESIFVDVQGGGACTLTTLNVTPSTTSQTITPSGEDGWDEVNVDAVTSAIDANIIAGNIRNGVSILGVQGTVEGGAPQNLTFTFADGTSGTYTFYAS